MIPLGDTLDEQLHEYIWRHRQALPGEKALFTSEQGKRLSRDGLSNMIRRMMKLVEVKGKGGVEKLRNTFAVIDLRRD